MSFPKIIGKNKTYCSTPNVSDFSSCIISEVEYSRSDKKYQCHIDDPDRSNQDQMHLSVWNHGGNRYNDSHYRGRGSGCNGLLPYLLKKWKNIIETDK